MGASALRVLGFDYGTRQIGVAVGQTLTGNARPLKELRARDGIPDWEQIAAAAFHDKKADGDSVTVTLVPAVGRFELKKMTFAEVIARARACYER